MIYRAVFFIGMLAALFQAGCPGKNVARDTMNDQLQVFGIALFSRMDYREINGVAAVEEPCLRGYERSFDRLDLSIGYGFDGTIRKITTRNSHTSMFGVRPGMQYEEGRKKIVQAGLKEHALPFNFRADRYSLTLLVDGSNTIFGLMLESLE